MKNSFQTLSLIGAAAIGLMGIASAQEVSLLKDINIVPSVPAAKPDYMINANGALYIATHDSISGSELWRSEPDGMGGIKIVLVKDVFPGKDDSLAVKHENTARDMSPNLTRVGNFVYFSATTYSNSAQLNQRNLWRTDINKAITDPTGTVLVKDFNIDVNDGGGPEKLINFNGTLLFESWSPNEYRELWAIDNAGTNPGTPRLVKDIAPGKFDSFMADQTLRSVGSYLYFTADDRAAGRELWRTDGTPAGTLLFANIDGGPGASNPKNLFFFEAAEQGPFLYFSATGNTPNQGNELWRIPVDASSTAEVIDIHTSGSSNPSNFTMIGDTMYFLAADASNFQALYTTIGGFAAPTFVRNLPGDENNRAGNFFAVKPAGENKLLFTATDPSFGNELWISGGTVGDTFLLKDIVGGVNGSNPSNFQYITPTSLIFTVKNGSSLSLWKTDGLAANTVEVKAFSDTDPNSIRNFVTIDSTIYFMLNNDELWKTDGTNSGTVLVKRLRATSSDSMAGNFAFYNGEVFFSASDGASGVELWRSNGTSEGTLIARDIYEQTFPAINSSYPQQLTTAGNTLYFTADNTGTERQELWKFDITGAAPVPLFPDPSEPTNLFAWNGNLFFAATDGSGQTGHGREPYFRNSTTGVTSRLGDLVNGFGSSDPKEFITMRGKVYFVAKSEFSNGALYETDGTEANTKEIPVEVDGSFAPTGLVVMKDKNNKEILYFAATDNLFGRELWQSDGTVKGTKRVKDIYAGSFFASPTELTVTEVGSRRTLFFAAFTGEKDDNGDNVKKLWRTDGTEAGTVLVKENTASSGIGVSYNPRSLVHVNGQLFFIATSKDFGEELWFIGSSATAMPIRVKDIIPGSGSPNIQNLTNINGIVVFTAEDGVHGRELWISDGTANGTFMVRDFTGDSASSDPSNFFVNGSELYFTASNYESGTEVYHGTIIPKMIVEATPGVPLVSGVDSVAFGTVPFPSQTTKTITITNKETGVDAALNFLRPIEATISGTNAAEFKITTKPAVSLNAQSPGNTTSIVIEFKPKEDGPRTATLTITSNDAINPFTIQLVGNGDKDPAITTQPISLMKVVGESATFSSAAVADNPSAILALQWKKNNSNIALSANATAMSPTFEIFQVSLKDAGAYTLAAKGAVNTAISNIAELAVVENIPKTFVLAVNASVTLTCNAAGNGLTYQWYKDNGSTALTIADPRVSNTASSGPKLKSVTIKGLTTADSNTYLCKVTGAGGTAVGGTTYVRVFDTAPDLDEVEFSHLTLGMPNGIVGGTYYYKIPLVDENDFDSTPTTYTVKNLPTGLKLDAKTGVITGKPTVGDKTFTVIVTASNAKSNATNKQSATKDVYIANFPGNLMGVYTGIVERNQELNGIVTAGVSNGGLGGRIDLTVTKTGSYTGTLLMGASKYTLKGILDIDVDQSPTGDLPRLNLEIKRSATLRPMLLSLEIENDSVTPANATFKESTSQISSNGQTAKIKGWRQVTLVTNPYTGYYTLGLRLPEDSDWQGESAKVPQGWGFAAFTVAAKDGKLALAGKTADGEKLTTSTFMGPSGQILVYQVMYATPVKGSLLGQLTVNIQEPTDLTDNTLTGELDWVRPKDVKPAARTYEAGFGATIDVPEPVELEAVGGHYGPLAKGELILGLDSPGTANASVLFFEGGLDDDIPAYEPDYSLFGVGLNNKITPATAPNPAKTKLAVVPAKGTFSGGFTLSDSNPRGMKPDPVVRAVKYEGMIIKDGSSLKGHGFFMLPERPQDTPVQTIPTTSNILSGSVLLDRSPPP